MTDFSNCPGLVGQITREILDSSLQPYPSFAWSAAYATISGLLGYSHRTSYSSVPPNIYLFNFAPYASGKDYPRKVMLKALNRANQSRLVTRDFRSALGFHKRIADGGSLQIVLQDEASHFFVGLKGQKAEPYIARIKPMLLQLFTSWDDPSFDAGTVVNQAGTLEPLVYPSLSYLGLSTPEYLELVFGAEDFQSGLLSRFLIFQDRHPVQGLRNIKKVPNQYDFETNEAWLKLLDYNQEFESYRRNFSKTGELPFIEVNYDRDALEYYIALTEEIAEVRNIKQDIGSPDLWGRASEMIGRVALGISYPNNTISLECVKWSERLVKDYVRFLEGHVGDLSGGEFGLWCDKVLNIIRDSGIVGVTRTELYRKCQFFKGSTAAKSLNDVLSLLIMDNHVMQKEDFKIGEKRTKKVRTFYDSSVFDNSKNCKILI